MQAEAATSSKATRSPQRRNQQQQDLQRNLRHFLSIASAGDLNTIYRNRPVWATNDEKYLTETALQVFKSVPSAKLAVLNYVGLLAHEGTHLHMSKCENSHFSVDASAIEGAVYRFAQVFNQSLNEIDTKEWATDMLRWSSLLLAEVCKQNAGRRATNGPAGPLTLVELLRVYVLCPCIEQVIDLLNASIKFLLNCDPESCISVIVETAKIYGANFDWIITHVGTMFPGAMVNPLLSVGLEEFRTYVTDLSVREAQLPQMTAAQLHEDYQLKFRSLSAILSHLARQQSAELKTSLRRLLVVSAY
uniref:Integrator complex subunit 5 N-terminal domain-containing protein n=1 Tax=Plectus sambesii TaxID=2011161 RepID=A0A914UIE5_9BILA